MADQALPLQLGKRRERRLDRAFGRPVDGEHDAQVDDVERVERRGCAGCRAPRWSGPRREKAGFHDASAPRRAPILVTITRSSG